MQAIALILLLLLTGCEYFPIDAKIEEMNRLSCKPDVSECSGFLKG